MEDLRGRLLLTTVTQNERKISPRGVEMQQLNAARWRMWKKRSARFFQTAEETDVIWNLMKLEKITKSIPTRKRRET